MAVVATEQRDKQRLNFDFTPERVEELKQLMTEAGVTSMKDLLNNALTLLEWSIAETRKGNEIAAVNEESQTFRVLVTPILERVKKLHSRSLTSEGNHAPAA